jgi:hypothetical protein
MNTTLTTTLEGLSYISFSTNNNRWSQRLYLQPDGTWVADYRSDDAICGKCGAYVGSDRKSVV